MSTKDAVRSAKGRGLRHDFSYYARHCLKVRSKSGAIVPFELNAVQRRVHEAAERQLAGTGRIRLLVLKARQPGISTYVARSSNPPKNSQEIDTVHGTAIAGVCRLCVQVK
jgi:hypothetical protein